MTTEAEIRALAGTPVSPRPDALPSIACVIFDQIKPDQTLEDFEQGVRESDTKLYV